MNIKVRIVVERDDGLHVGEYEVDVDDPRESPTLTLLTAAQVGTELVNGLAYLITHECDAPEDRRRSRSGARDHWN